VEANICVGLLDARLLFREHGIGFAGVYSTLHKTCESSVAIHCLSGCQSEGFFSSRRLQYCGRPPGTPQCKVNDIEVAKYRQNKRVVDSEAIGECAL
jgi:hypothetical protein